MEVAEKNTSEMLNNKREVHEIGGKKISRGLRTEQATKDKPVEQCYHCQKGGHHPAKLQI